MGPARMSQVETSIRVVIDFNEAFNQHDIKAMMQLMSDDCLFENTNPAPDGTMIKGKDAVTQFWEAFSVNPRMLISRSRRSLASAFDV